MSKPVETGSKAQAECWTCKREPLIVCRINPNASDRFYRRPHYPHKAECYETTADVRIKLTESMAARHRDAGHDVREVSR